MKELIAHTEFLLLRHQCIIIPDFGGFVLNYEPADVDAGSGRIIAPSLSVGFNADMNFNDGLLAESFMQQFGTSYDSALQQIEYAVKQMKLQLGNLKTIGFGSLGVLKFEEGRVVFEPASKTLLIHPSVWGYTDVKLKRLEDIMITASERSERKYNLRYIITGVASTAAALMIWVMSGTINNNILQPIQQSGYFVSTQTQYQAKAVGNKQIISMEKEAILNDYTEQLKANYLEMPIVKDLKTVTSGETVREKRYYIILGGDTNRSRAEVLAESFKNKGFTNADVVDAPDRFRVYVASFRGQDEANDYLVRFRKKFPAFEDAWVYSNTVTVQS